DFMLTYGDGLSDVDIPALLNFHQAHGRAASVTGVRPPSRFGELVVAGPQVRRFSEKPVETGHINGGFFAFKRRFLDYVSDDESCILERAPLERAAEDGELMMFEHAGFWQCMDTYRDLLKLEEAWNGGNAPWRTW
ncbi:MAG: glucose-1-phosphate cytidylyltransferase, partial [Phycisphaerae bacterium]|nr:glucose-1-phosphate cytidylyltransferase [Phycisphaerae bacterium]